MASITEFDIVFLSLDEINAEKNWADLSEKAPWSKRVHGVKGFDAAHRACAEASETDWLITVDADNIVRPEFFDIVIDDKEFVRTKCMSWNGLNAINGLSYGNGGLKLWRKSFLLEMACHELSENPQHVDFCWESGYKNMLRTYSDVYNNASPYQAFRVGFREGVKLSLDRGERISGEMMKTLLHPVNLRNLRIWSCVGAHVENGLWAMYGARLAWSMMLDTDWDHGVVKDYDWFDKFWITYANRFANYSQPDDIFRKTLTELGNEIERKTRIKIPMLSEDVSSFFKDTYTYRNE
jgi:hypothetical protein